ncbi:MAG: hypothetical protein H6670_12570 [Anaerolineaceae bacterium]|nr:hypothetical protein [Anaerolineaceae bacterium]
MPIKKWLVLLLALIFVLPGAQSQENVVYGVFFYSPTCPHCHEVITNHWPGIAETFGDQLQVMFIDVTTEMGAQIMNLTRQAMGIESTGVPMLIIGDNVLIGSVDIPARTPDIVREGIDNGGISFPPVPILQMTYDAAVAREAAANSESSTTSSETETGGETEADSETETTSAVTETATEAEATLDSTVAAQEATLFDKLAQDPVANIVAVIVLIALITSMIIFLFAFRKERLQKIARPALIALGIGGLIVGGALFAGSLSEGAVALLPAILLLVFAVLLINSLRAGQKPMLPYWIVPVLAIAGLVAAGYLTSVEMSEGAEAVCGAVGNCNAVQQSEYARLFGIPVSILGLGVYIVILLVWGYTQFFSDKHFNNFLWLIALLGVAFSAYLTFLEPFVIGATCLWCLTSALVMMALLWVLVPYADVLQPPQRTTA